MFKDKLFFFGAQEWVNFFQVQTQVLTVPTELMRQGNFSELLDPNNGYYSGARVIVNPATGLPFPGNIVPAELQSATGMAFLRAFPSPTPGFRAGREQRDHHQPQPAGPAEGQHPLRLPAERSQPVHLPVLPLQLGGR